MNIIDQLNIKLAECGHFERLSLYLDDPQNEAKPFRYRVIIEDDSDLPDAQDAVTGIMESEYVSSPRDWVEMGARQLSVLFQCSVIGYYSSIKVVEYGQAEA